jgi:hypothetical protein
MDDASGADTRWVLSILVNGDDAGVMAVTAEGLVKSVLWQEPAGAQPILSTVARFADLSRAEQDRWELLLSRENEW